MRMFRTELGRFTFNEDGATAIEYGLIAALVAVGSIFAMTASGASLSGLFNYVSDTAGNAMQKGFP